MVVIVLERVSASLRGEITRWMIELRAGVFVGDLSATVRDRLWEYACGKVKGGAALLVHASDNEQGFAIRCWNDTSRRIVDFDGLRLAQLPK